MTTDTLHDDPAAESKIIDVMATPAEEPAAPETATDETAEEREGNDPDRDEKGRFKADGVQKRMNELTRARREAERQAEYWRGIATQTAPVAATEKPSRDQFADPDDYVEALTEWKADQAVAKSQQSQAVHAESSARNAVWSAREAEAKASIPDYDSVVPASTVEVKQHVIDALLDSEAGPSLVYHLAKNPDIAARLNGMSPMSAAIELGRLESTLAAPVAKAPSNAPPPTSPIGGAATMTRDPTKMSTADYVAWRRSQPVF